MSNDYIREGQKRTLNLLINAGNSKPLVAYTQKQGNKPSQWIPLSGAGLPVDYYTVMSCQLVFERDEGGWESIREYHLKLDTLFKRKAIPYLLSDTGGKGLHHEVFIQFHENDFDRINNVKKEGLDDRFIRIFLVEHLEEEAGIHDDQTGDRSCVSWSNERKGHLIRLWGGKKYNLDGTLSGFKSLIDNVPDKKELVTSPEDVIFPTEIKLWTIPPMIVDELLKAWVNFNSPERQREREAINKGIKEFEGRYSELPCVKTIQTQGAPVGQRNKAVLILISAYVLDKFPKNGIYWAVEEFFQNCPDQSELNEDELYNIVDWFLHKQDVFWECYTPTKHGYCVKECEMKYNILTLVSTTPTSLVYRKRNLIFEIKAIKTKDEGITCRINVFYQLNPYVSEEIHRDKVSLWSHRERTKLVNAIIKKTKTIDKKELEDTVFNLEDRLVKDFKKQNEILKQQKEEKEKLTEKEKCRAIELLRTPKLLFEINIIIGRLGVAGDEKNRLTIYLNGVSRLLDDPSNIVIKGSSASGKSYPIQIILLLFPPDSFLDLTDATAQSLLYLQENDLEHKWLIIFERHGSEKADYSIRTIQSEKKLKILTVKKNRETGELESYERVVNGPVSTIETTTESIIQVENETRLLSLYTDDSPEQTKLTFEVASKKYEPPQHKMGEEELREWRNAQKVLRPYKVIIPYVILLQNTFPLEPVRVRRDYPRFLSMIEDVAFLHQYQRSIIEIDGVKYIIATLADYYITKELMEASLARTINQLPPKSEELLRIAEDLEKQHRTKLYEEQDIDEKEVNKTIFEFTRKDLEKETKWSNDVVRNWSKPLEKGGYFEVISGGKGKKYMYRLTGKLPDNLRLPPISEVRKWIFDNIDDLPIKPKELQTTELQSGEGRGNHIDFIGEVYDPITGSYESMSSFNKTEARKLPEVEDIEENEGLNDISTSEVE